VIPTPAERIASGSFAAALVALTIYACSTVPPVSREDRALLAVAALRRACLEIGDQPVPFEVDAACAVLVPPVAAAFDAGSMPPTLPETPDAAALPDGSAPNGVRSVDGGP
jgi:hypothetical protein